MRGKKRRVYEYRKDIQTRVRKTIVHVTFFHEKKNKVT